MKRIGLALLAMVLAILPTLGAAQDPDSGAHLISQSAADALREFAGADGAFLAAGSLKNGASRDNLASILADRTDTPAVVTLTGAQVRLAIERSISLYPQASSFFLQLSGFEVTFKRNASASPRIVSLTVGGNRVEDGKTYTVAMPSSLARGALGYFKVWDKNKISKTFTVTMESVLKGHRYTDTAPRYSVVD